MRGRHDVNKRCNILSQTYGACLNNGQRFFHHAFTLGNSVTQRSESRNRLLKCFRQTNETDEGRDIGIYCPAISDDSQKQQTEEATEYFSETASTNGRQTKDDFEKKEKGTMR